MCNQYCCFCVAEGCHKDSCWFCVFSNVGFSNHDVFSNIMLSMHMFSNVIKPCMKPSMNNNKMMFIDLAMSIPQDGTITS